MNTLPKHPVAKRVRGIRFVWVLIFLTLAALVVTVGLIASVAYFRSNTSLRMIESDHYRVAVSEVTNEVRQLLRPGAGIVREFQNLLQRGLLFPENLTQIGGIFAERLRNPICLTGLSLVIGDKEEFIGVRRTPDGRLLLKIIPHFGLGGGYEIERLIAPDGSLGPIQFSKFQPFDPQKRAWYLSAVRAAGRVVWLPPYKFMDGQYGISAASAVFADDSAQFIGALCADFSLQAIEHALTTLFAKQHRLIFLTMGDRPITENSTLNPTLTEELRQYCLQANLPTLEVNPEGVAVKHFQWKGVDYVTALTKFLLNGEVECHVGLVAAESDFLNVAKKNIVFAMEVAACAFGVAVFIAVILSMKLARPLSQISRDLEQAAHFRTGPARFSSSPLYEVQALGNATQDMKRGMQSFARYVPDYVVRKLLSENQEARPEAAPREITVFVSDLEGFTRLGENLSANQLVEQLDEYFELVIPTVEKRFGGMVDKLLGDGILALFNALDERPDHAENACDAAISIIQELEEVSKKRFGAGLPVLKARIGLATGTALVGNFGTENRLSFSAAGEAVAIATRLERLNKQFGTFCLVTGQTRWATGNKFEWRALTEQTFFDRSVEIFELLGRCGEVKEHILQARDSFEQARKALAAGDLQKARSLLKRSLELRPNELGALLLKQSIHG